MAYGFMGLWEKGIVEGMQWGGFNINGFMDLRRKEEIEWGKAFQGD